MPTYEYRCTGCGHELEEFQSIMAKPLKKCPKCGKNKLARLISAGAGIIFRGSGFYETDYRSDAYKAAAKKDSPDAATPSPAATEKGGPAAEKKTAEAAKPADTKPASPPAAEGTGGNGKKATKGAKD